MVQASITTLCITVTDQNCRTSSLLNLLPPLGLFLTETSRSPQKAEHASSLLVILDHGTACPEYNAALHTQG